MRSIPFLCVPLVRAHLSVYRPCPTMAEGMLGETSGDQTEDLYKVLVIGDYGVGKTSIIRRYTDGYFSPSYKVTIGVDYALKTVEHEGRKVGLQLWDISGHERFNHMTHVYYKYAIAAVIVYDLSRPATFASVLKWHKDVNDKVMLPNGEPVPVILLANKHDVCPAEIDKEKLDRFCQDQGFLAWFATSAKLDKNVNDAMSFLVKSIVDIANEVGTPQKPGDTIQLGAGSGPTAVPGGSGKKATTKTEEFMQQCSGCRPTN